MREEVSVSLFRTQNWNWSLTNASLPSLNQTPWTGRGTGGASAALGAQVLSQVGEQGKEFGVEFYRPSWNLQERGGSKQLHWLGSWIFFFFFFL